VAKKLKTPRRKSVTKPVRRYDTSGKTLGSRVSTRRTPKVAKTELVTSKSGNVYRRPVRAATPSKRIAPRNIYTKGSSPAILGTGTQKVGASRGGGFRGGFPPRDTTGGTVKQATQADIKAMQKQMNADRNANRLRTELNEFNRRFSNLKRKLSGIQGNPGLRGIFMGGGGGSKR